MFNASDMQRQHELLTEVAVDIDAGKLRTTVERHLSPVNARNMREAHAWVETGRAMGKVVVEGF